MSHLSRLVLGAGLLFCCEFAIAQTGGTEYFPLKPKTRWTYKVQDQTVEVLVSGTEKYNNEDCTKVDTIVNGKVVASELYSIKPDGVYRVKVKDDKIDPPVKILMTPPKKGESWDVKSKVGTQTVSGKFKIVEVGEKITVPAGTYDAVLVEGVDLDIAGTKTTVKTWYAKNVGVVKLLYKIQDSESVMELQKFEEGK